MIVLDRSTDFQCTSDDFLCLVQSNKINNFCWTLHDHLPIHVPTILPPLNNPKCTFEHLQTSSEAIPNVFQNMFFSPPPCPYTLWTRSTFTLDHHQRPPSSHSLSHQTSFLHHSPHQLTIYNHPSPIRTLTVKI